MAHCGSTTAATPALVSPTRYDAQLRFSWTICRNNMAQPSPLMWWGILPQTAPTQDCGVRSAGRAAVHDRQPQEGFMLDDDEITTDDGGTGDGGADGPAEPGP